MNKDFGSNLMNTISMAETTHKRKEYNIHYLTKSSTKSILKFLGLESNDYELFNDQLINLFDEYSEFAYLNSYFGPCKIISSSSRGITLYMPNLDTEFLQDNFKREYGPFTRDSLRLNNITLKKYLEDAYESIPKCDKGLFISLDRSERRRDGCELLDNVALDILRGIHILMPNCTHKFQIDATDIMIYKYGDFYHFAAGDAVHPAAHLLGIYYAYVEYNSYDV